MKFVGPIRKALQFPTIFNLLGPLVNPSQPQCQLLGVANLDQMRLYNSVYQKLGIDYGIVNSIDGYDEISLTGDFKVTTNSYETSASTSPSPKNWWVAPPRKRRHRSSTPYSRTVPCRRRRISCWPMPPSVYRCSNADRRASRSASPWPASRSTADGH